MSMHSFYINLDRRTDRRAQFEGECAKMGIDVERFQAVAHQVPAIGCGLSHLAVLKLARARGYESVCIFEDDFEFLVGRPEFDTVLSKLPPNFDVVMLGWYNFESNPYNELFNRVSHATTTSCYIVHSKFYDQLIDVVEEGMRLFHNHPSDIHIYSIDQYWRKLQPAANWYHTVQRVGRQRPSFSDLRGTFVVNEH
jgi:GR25 family glycosyltransferase involved in LPS biosynthesis